jgi:hypothetical protein
MSYAYCPLFVGVDPDDHKVIVKAARDTRLRESLAQAAAGALQFRE